MPRITLKDALYSPFADEFVGKDVAESTHEIDTVLRKHVSAIGRERGHSYLSAQHHYLCSTIMDSVFSAAAMDAVRSLGDDYAVVPQSFTHAYECACWGYCMQYHVEHKREQASFAISIMDVNSMEMSYWSSNEQWGKSGFGITTLFFEVDGEGEGDPSKSLHTGVAAGGNNIIAFASVAKQVVKNFQASRLSLPFFPENMSVPVRRALKGVELLTECHSAYGHAFGSDPWISFIRDHAQSDLAGQRIVFGSLALRGYYCFADIDIDADVNVRHF
jgi:hypothetical protein